MFIKDYILEKRYKLIELINSGGMGEVWKALDLVLDRVVAIKIVNANFTTKNPNAVKILKSEAKAGAKLMGCRNVVTTLDFCSTLINEKIVYFIVMEYIEGKSLSDWLNEDYPKLDNYTKLTLSYYISLQICKAIEYAHRRKTLHRDIKPLNVFLSYDGEIKVGDFGLSKFINEATRTHTVNQLGSASYTAPEQWMNKKYTIDSDIYQLGVTLYETISGVLPFSGNAYSLMNSHINDLPQELFSKNSNIDEKVSNVIMKSLRKESNERCEMWELVDVLAKKVQCEYTLKCSFEDLNEMEKKAIIDITDASKDTDSLYIDIPDYNEAISEALQISLRGINTIRIICE